MNATGIIVEYNPFHNGHKYHLDKAKSNGDLVIAVMSGDFVQRGEVAIINRWKRAEMALENGVDIVVELPVFYSTQSAEIFARGAIGILDKLAVKNIVFGSETANLETLEAISSIEENNEFSELLKKFLDNGDSYPTAYSKSLDIISGSNLKLNSNDILGLEYIKAIKYWKSNIIPVPIKREKAGYHSTLAVENIASATGIRKFIKENCEFEKFVPEFSYSIIRKEQDKNSTTYMENFYPLIKYIILRDKMELKNIQDMEVGFENRLFESALKSDSYLEFFDSIISKRMTIGRTQRILIHTLLGITKSMTEEVKQEVPYIRIMGFNSKGREYLKSINSDVPILTSLKNIKKNLSEKNRKLLEFNEKSSNIYNIINPYTNNKIPIMIQEEKCQKESL
ncbi:MAG: nucleotidyltransferase [Cetobacterium sp.]|uniref:nucleotidyltransferase n=1 Tax=unclassified Cetobacterium TaxID=2630983 RepID=UPI00163B9A80|nr:nucleotidyltransferase [Cetobacterium sp. 2A]MBC2855919.1 nucleotidyltransferase [Cetobacterium sp. 2A]